jgi:hypothetical protein
VVLTALTADLRRKMGPGLNPVVFLGPGAMLLGVVFGIVALCGIPRHGRKGILWPALIGIALNVFILVAGVYASMTVIERARELEAKGDLREQR